jgi:hypothetical protein
MKPIDSLIARLSSTTIDGAIRWVRLRPSETVAADDLKEALVVIRAVGTN